MILKTRKANYLGGFLTDYTLVAYLFMSNNHIFEKASRKTIVIR